MQGIDGPSTHTICDSNVSISASLMPFSAKNRRLAEMSSCTTCGEVKKVFARCNSSDLSSTAGGGGVWETVVSVLRSCDGASFCTAPGDEDDVAVSEPDMVGERKGGRGNVRRLPHAESGVQLPCL